MNNVKYYSIEEFKRLLIDNKELHIGKYINKNIYYSIEIDENNNLVVIEHEGKKKKNIIVVKEPDYSFKANFEGLKCFIELIKNKTNDNKIIHEIFKNSEFAATDYMESYEH